MTTNRWGHIEGYQNPNWRVDFNWQLEQAAERATHSRPRRIRRRQLTLGSKSYVAYDAHDLLDATAEMGRPGHPY